jgi:hypothetical protein
VECSIAALLLWAYTHETIRHHARWLPVYFAAEPYVQDTIQQFRIFPVRPKPGSSVIFLHDPLGSYDTLFISSLTWNDHTVVVLLQKYSHLPQEQIDRLDYVFDFIDNRLTLVRGPAG